MSVFAQRVAYRGAVVEFLEPSSLQGVQQRELIIPLLVRRNENPGLRVQKRLFDSDRTVQSRTAIDPIVRHAPGAAARSFGAGWRAERARSTRYV